MPYVRVRCLSRIRGKVFGVLDLLAGYHQIELTDRAKRLTGYYTARGIVCSNRMTFGLRNAPASFSKIVNRILDGVEGCFPIPAHSIRNTQLRLLSLKLEDSGLALRDQKAKSAI